jgi:hypothetical protein
VKVGDLVELSSYGRRLKCNRYQKGKVGIVTMNDMHEVASPQDSITVSWSGFDFDDWCYHFRRELKRVR